MSDRWKDGGEIPTSSEADAFGKALTPNPNKKANIIYVSHGGLEGAHHGREILDAFARNAPVLRQNGIDAISVEIPKSIRNPFTNQEYTILNHDTGRTGLETEPATLGPGLARSAMNLFMETGKNGMKAIAADEDNRNNYSRDAKIGEALYSISSHQGSQTSRGYLERELGAEKTEDLLKNPNSEEYHNYLKAHGEARFANDANTAKTIVNEALKGKNANPNTDPAPLNLVCILGSAHVAGNAPNVNEALREELVRRGYSPESIQEQYINMNVVPKGGITGLCDTRNLKDEGKDGYYAPFPDHVTDASEKVDLISAGKSKEDAKSGNEGRDFPSNNATTFNITPNPSDWNKAISTSHDLIDRNGPTNHAFKKLGIPEDYAATRGMADQAGIDIGKARGSYIRDDYKNDSLAVASYPNMNQQDIAKVAKNIPGANVENKRLPGSNVDSYEITFPKSTLKDSVLPNVASKLESNPEFYNAVKGQYMTDIKNISTAQYFEEFTKVLEENSKAAKGLDEAAKAQIPEHSTPLVKNISNDATIPPNTDLIDNLAKQKSPSPNLKNPELPKNEPEKLALGNAPEITMTPEQIAAADKYGKTQESSTAESKKPEVNPNADLASIKGDKTDKAPEITPASKVDDKAIATPSANTAETAISANSKVESQPKAANTAHSSEQKESPVSSPTKQGPAGVTVHTGTSSDNSIINKGYGSYATRAQSRAIQPAPKNQEPAAPAATNNNPQPQDTPKRSYGVHSSGSAIIDSSSPQNSRTTAPSNVNESASSENLHNTISQNPSAIAAAGKLQSNGMTIQNSSPTESKPDPSKVAQNLKSQGVKPVENNNMLETSQNAALIADNKKREDNRRTSESARTS